MSLKIEYYKWCNKLDIWSKIDKGFIVIFYTIFVFGIILKFLTWHITISLILALVIYMYIRGYIQYRWLEFMILDFMERKKIEDKNNEKEK